MADLTPETVDDVVAACKLGADEAAVAFSRALDAKIAVSLGQPSTLAVDALPDELSGPGLAVVLIVGGAGALVLLSESSGLVPSWCENPDPAGQSKLTTLAQELGMLLLPEQLMPEDFKTARVKNLADALRRGGVSDGAAILPLELSAEGKQGTARIIWPVPKPGSVVGAGTAKTPPEAKTPPDVKPGPPDDARAQHPEVEPKPGKAGLKHLPGYARSLLRIKVPVIVTLAEKRQPLGRIVELGPGSIIQFDKSCEEMLDLDIGDRRIANGEAVKVGDKFGLRITSIVPPEERFQPVRGKMTKHE